MMTISELARFALKRQLALQFANSCHSPKDGRFCSDVMSAARAARAAAPEAVQRAIDGYTGTDYRRINNALRGKRESSPEVDELIENIDKAFAHHTIATQGIPLYRGLPVDSKTAKRMFPGVEIPDLGYMSTSTDVADTSNFTVGGGTVIIIKTKKGTKAIAGADRESELILPRGTILRIKSRKENRGYTEVVAEIVDVAETVKVAA